MNKSSVQRGFAAIAAIFLIVVLATLGVYMATFSSSQQVSAGQDLQGIRAYWAARSGLEWAVSSTPVGTTSCWPDTSLAIDVFTVTVTCRPSVTSAYTDLQAASPSGVLPTTGPVYIFQFMATATVATNSTPGTFGYFDRSVSASLER